MRVLLFLNVLGYSNEYGSSNLGNIAQLWNVCRAVSFSWCMTVLGGCIMRREECVRRLDYRFIDHSYQNKVNELILCCFSFLFLFIAHS